MTQDKLLEQAIELLALADFSNLKLAAERNEVVKAGVELLLQPRRTEQEPVAWGVFEGNLHDMFFTLEEAHEMARLKGSHAKVKPLYTHPTRGTWVGLTDDEIALINADYPHPQGFARAIEAKLKEKNT